tara:strand:+ start:55 stop:891 length:837 start_codon:yes stop_codon:yes gene_type:complete
MIKEYRRNIKCETQHPHPVESPDYLNPAGSIEDNHSNAYFIYELDSFFNGMPYRLMDIGCAGGQFIVDVYHKGYPWLGVGIEGGNILGMTEEFEERETCTGDIITKARGHENWTRYKDKCLFHADVTKPFKIINTETKTDIKFDIITAYEFFEHPLPEEIPYIIENIKNHLALGGRVCGTINLSSGGHHRCARSVEWWDDIFRNHGFEVQDYPFRTSPRTTLEYLTKLQTVYDDHEPQDVCLIDETVIPLRYFTKDAKPGVYPACFYLPNPNSPESIT